MDRRTFLMAVAAVPLAAVGLGAATKAWPVGAVIGRSPHGGPARPAWAGDVIVGVWDGSTVVRHGRTSVLRHGRTSVLLWHGGMARLVPAYVNV